MNSLCARCIYAGVPYTVGGPLYGTLAVTVTRCTQDERYGRDVTQGVPQCDYFQPDPRATGLPQCPPEMRAEHGSR